MTNNREIVKQYSAVFVAPVRNCAPYLDNVFKNIEKIGSLFKQYTCVFAESDSSDNTIELLREYSLKNRNVTVLELGQLEHKIQSRTIRIATARNACLKYCEDNNLLDSHEYYIQLCVDDVNSEAMFENDFLSCFNYDTNLWAGMCANQNTYYDLWTLRCEGWLNYDCWYELRRNKPPYMSDEDAYKILIGSRHIKIPKNFGLIEVESAHGGFSIFRSKFVKGCFYKGYNPETNFEESDLVSFCQGIRANGGRIFINSQLINIHDN